MTTTTWHETKTRLAPRYSVTNERYETTYSIPLEQGDGGSIDLTFRLAPDSEYDDQRSGRPQVQYFLALPGRGGEPALLTKDDIVTLQRLLTSVLEHSRIRRFEWLAERESVPSGA